MSLLLSGILQGVESAKVVFSYQINTEGSIREVKSLGLQPS